MDRVFKTCLSPALDDNYLSKNNASTEVGKKYLNFPLITPMPGTFGFQKGLKVLSNKVFRFIQQTLVK